MADQRQMKRLLKNVETWNTWREQYPTIKPDLSKANLSKANLSDANLSDVDFIAVNLSGANLSNAVLSGADFRDANLRSTILSDAILRNTILSGADLQDVDFRDANLSGVILSGANLSGANLSSAILDEAILSGANLRNANLSGADLDGSNLRNATFIDANLSGASLDGANLSGANLSGANLSGANIGWTSFGDHDFRMIKGLETIEHRGPSPLSINSLYLSDGDIPEQFLRGTGAQDTFIDYVKSLTKRPIEYYTCFISYSSKDESFAKRLYTDLQQEGVRCWYAPEDLKWGERIGPGIDEAIRKHEKLLLILSKHSIESGWVEREVKTALTKERKEQSTVLFPLRLDKTILECPFSWATEIRHNRNMGDFTRWKDHDTYQQSLQRLLRDFKQERT